MSLLWQKNSAGKSYQVRQAGASLRLYTDGTFHSQYNERQPLSGNLWNMLALPAYLHPGRLNHILVLGVGGGAVLRHLAQLAPQANIVGVDLDATHLTIARRFFKVRGRRVKLVHADAVHWLTQYSGPRFDLIIDDLFGETKDVEQLPVRAVTVTKQWLQALQSRLQSGGIVGLNIESPAQAKNIHRRLKQSPLAFEQWIQITQPRYHNAVVALLQRKVTQCQIDASLALEPVYRRWQQRECMPYEFLLRTIRSS